MNQPVIPTREFLEGKTFRFALRIAKAGRVLSARKVEYVYIRQLIRSGTSVGANFAEAVVAQSKADFISKSSIALKECRETIFWIRLLKELEAFSNDEAESLLQDSEELAKLLFTTVRTSKSKQ